MASPKFPQPHPDGVQLALNLPGFDFAPAADEPEPESKTAMPQVADSVAGQLAIQLDS